MTDPVALVIIALLVATIIWLNRRYDSETRALRQTITDLRNRLDDSQR